MILHKDISKENQEDILALIKNENDVAIRFINMEEEEKKVAYKVGAYYSIETNYRLFLFSSLFSSYNKMLYLDCDIIVNGDISELYSMPFEDMPVIAVKSNDLLYKEASKSAVFVNNKPYNLTSYKKEILGLNNTDNYFNAGVMLFDLEKCRQLTTFEKVLETLHSTNFYYNDQDTLNIIFKDKAKLIDPKWNYVNSIEYYLSFGSEKQKELYKSLKREDMKIIHYIGAKKPWRDKIILDEIFKKYEEKLKNQAK